MSLRTFLILPSLQQPLCDLVLLDDVDVCSPSTQSVSVHSVEERLRDRLEQILRPEIRFPETFARAKKLVARGAGDDEVLREVDAADRVESKSPSTPSLTYKAALHTTYPQMKGSPVV